MTLPEAAGLLLSFVARLITGAQGHWHGSVPKAEQRIYFANHQSHLDWVLIWCALPSELRSQTRPIAAKDYWTSTPFKHWITREIFNAVYVNRQRTDDQDPLEPLAEALKHGDSLVIFPEGTRSADGTMREFMPLIGNLVLNNKVDVLPLWLGGTHKALPKGAKIPIPRKRKVEVRIGPPLTFEQLEQRVAGMKRSDAYREVARLAHDAVAALRELQRRFHAVLPVRRHIPDHSPILGVLRAQLVAQHGAAHGTRQPELLDQEPGAAGIRDQPDLAEGLDEARPRCGDRQIAGHGDRGACTCRHAVDGRDRRHRSAISLRTVGLKHCSMMGPGSARWTRSGPGSKSNSARSAPAQKPRPAPVSTRARMDLSASTRAKASHNSWCMRRVKLLSACGRLSVTRATGPRASYSTVACCSMGLSPCAQL